MTFLRPDFMTIVQGEDRNIALRIAQADGSPFSLTDITDIRAKFRRADNSLLALTLLPSNGTHALKLYNQVTFTAVEIGVVGNSIELEFDGNTPLQSVVDAWNTAHPGNKVAHNHPTGLFPLPAGTVTLEGGVDDYSSIEVTDEHAGRITVNIDDAASASLRLGDRQNFSVELDAGTERRIVNFTRALSVVAPAV